MSTTNMKSKQSAGRSKPHSASLAIIRRRLRTGLPMLRERYGVRALWLFGSYVRGEQRERSDLDVLVEFERTPTLLEFAALQRNLNILLGIKVDLVMKTALKPEIGRRILAEAVAL